MTGFVGGRRRVCALLVTACLVPVGLAARQDTTRLDSATFAGGDSVSVRFTNAQLRAVIQALARYLDRPVLVGSVPSVQVTFESPRPVPRHEVLGILRGLAGAHGLELHIDSAFYRVAPAVDGRQRAGRANESGAAGQAQRLFVIRLKHARAADVAGTVGALFGIAVGAGGARGFSAGTLSEELRRTAVPPAGAPPEPTRAPVPDTQGADLRGAVTIVADGLTNSLLVRSTEADYQVIAQAVEQLDLRPLQVLIQVLIVEARKDRLFALGVEGETGDIDVDGARGRATFRPGGGLGQLVLQIMQLGTFDIDALLRLAVSNGDARIVSRPVLLASNNREARILVGSQRPFIQVSRSLPTDAGVRDQVVQYRDVGTALTVLPTINADGYVSLLIRQEVNSATAETQFDAPVISTREAETEVLVRDRQTIVLGGLRERQFEAVRTGIPILSDIPILGGLFGSQERRTTETELFLFITPMILGDDATAAEATSAALERAQKAAGKLPERD